MPNAWVEHVKKFAKEKGLSYGCALSDPNLKKGYVPKGQKTKKKKEKVDDEKKYKMFISQTEKAKKEEKRRK